jgi:diaminopimelate epimerase
MMSGLTDKREIRVETQTGIIGPRLEEDGNVTVDMGIPRFCRMKSLFCTTMMW